MENKGNLIFLSNIELITMLIVRFTDMSNIWKDLIEIQKVWSEQYPRRAQGGQVSIRGFDYQIKLFLLKVVEQWIEQTPLEKTEYKTSFYPLMESISDILDVNKDIIVATQIKYALRSGSLGDSLEEFNLIYNLIKGDFPHLLPMVRFKLISNRSELQDIEKSMDGWLQRNKSIVNNGFISHVSISIDTNPEYRLLALLANKLQCSEPLTVLHRWLGIIVDASVLGTTLEHAGKIIWDNLHSMWRDLRPSNGIYVLQSSDYPPNEVLPGTVLTGQRPNIRHLRDGFFHRRDVYDEVKKNFFRWVDELITEQDDTDKIPIFWIGGRSGSGKSVALLHLLSDLNESGLSPVIWLGHHTSLLVPAFHFALNNRSEPISIIGLDDPYVVEDGVSQHWDDFFAMAHSLMQNERSHRLPIIIACGPTEQANLFRNDYGEYLKFFRHDIPYDTNTEHEILHEWYFRRTGNLPPSIDNSNALLVQLFFQWDKHETIAEFSTRLKERLSLDDDDKAVLNKVSRIIALNRLYIGYCKDAVRHDLTASQADQLDWLEEDLHLGEREVDGKSGYWLLHAHLANSVFLNWYGNRHSSYKEHFKQAVLDCFNHGKKPIEKTAPMWVIAQILANKNNLELRSRMDPNTAQQLAVDIYNEIIAKINPLPVSILPVWIDISIAVPELKLKPDPVSTALSMIHPDMAEETGLRLTCHKLLNHFEKLTQEKQVSLTNALKQLLAEAPTWSGWVYILDHVIKKTRDIRFIPLLKQRIQLYPLDYRVSNLLRLALNTWPRNEDVKILMIQALSHAPCTSFWCDLIKQYIQSIQEVHEEVYQWIYNFRKSSKICFVLGEALKLDYNRFEQIALEWLSLWDHEMSANYVLEPLLQNQPQNLKVREHSINWIKVGTGDKGFVLEHLLENMPTQEVIEYIFYWLETEGKHRKTSGVLLEKLMGSDIYNDKTLEFSLNWLTENIQMSKTWPILWISCYRKYSGDETLFTLGVNWLETTEITNQFWGHILLHLDSMQPQLKLLETYTQIWKKSLEIDSSNWIYNWINLFASFDTDLDLLNKGIEWLESNKISHPLWMKVYGMLCEKATSHPKIVHLAEHFLKDNDTESAWPRIWQSIFKAYPYKDWLLETAYKWLQVNYSHNSWTYIWRAIFEQYPSDMKIMDLGMTWLEKNEINHSYPYIWLNIFSRYSLHPPLLPLGIRYLDRLEDTEAWFYVWQSLNNKFYEREYLNFLGVEWLKKSRSTSSVWPQVFHNVYNKFTVDTSLTHLGIQWLTESSMSHSMWGHVWTTLMNTTSNQDLISLGFNRLMSLELSDNWHVIWVRLIKVQGMTDDLFKLGLEWITKEEYNSKNWVTVWNQLFKSERQRDQVVHLGISWIQKIDISHSSFEHIWGFLFTLLPNDPMLNKKALSFLYLHRHSKPGSWYNVWQRLLKSTRDNKQLISLGYEFLKNVKANIGSWASVWLELYNYEPFNSWLNQTGREWLFNTDNSNNIWTQIWLKVYPNFPRDWQLRNKGINWLKNNKNTSKGDWPKVWLHIHNYFKANWTVQLGMEWLSVFNRSCWVDVWNTLLTTNKEYEDRLIQLGNEWIIETNEDNPNVPVVRNQLKQFSN
jgi:hypothetical protein